MVRVTRAAMLAAKAVSAPSRAGRWYQANRQAVFNLVAGAGLFVVSVRGVVMRGQLKDAEKDLEASNAHLDTLQAVLTAPDSKWRSETAEALGLDAAGSKRLVDELDRAVAMANAVSAKDAVDIESLGGAVQDAAPETEAPSKAPSKPTGMI